VTDSWKHLILTVVGFFGLALIAVKVGGLFGLDLLWLYAVAAVLAGATVGERVYRRRRGRRQES
jgi:uncharacterized membrane protein YdjX (TVP38/TMEM64 family)